MACSYCPGMTDTLDFMARTAAIGSIGSAFYFRPETVATGKEHGLDGFRFYFLGRGGVLGDVEAPVVVSAFGYFQPDLVAKMWNTAKEKMAPREAARLYHRCAHDFGRSKLADAEGLDAFCAAMEKIDDAIDPTGLALYAGMSAEPRPEDLPARAMHLCTVVREGRGSAHLLAVRAAGLHPRAAHQLKRPDDLATFGWEPMELDDGDADKAARAESLTDELMAPAFGVLDATEQEAVVTGLERIGAAIA